jgi:hypothetical protein
MSNFPCKECIVKSICKELCPKALNKGYLSRQLYFHIRWYISCPDCGCLTGTKYNGEWMSTIECSECGSQFFPTTTKDRLVTIYRNGKRPREHRTRERVFNTKFKYYIDELDRARSNI